MTELQKELERVVQIKDMAERSIHITAIIVEALRGIGQDPILVGGAAVEFYTQGGYSTCDIDLEFPSRNLKPDETTTTIQVGSRSLRIVSIEDLIVDRLCAFKFWHSPIDGVNALLLLELGQSDEERLLHRAKVEQVTDALEVLNSVREEVIRKKLPRRQANQLLGKKMRDL